MIIIDSALQVMLQGRRFRRNDRSPRRPRKSREITNKVQQIVSKRFRVCGGEHILINVPTLSRWSSVVIASAAYTLKYGMYNIVIYVLYYRYMYHNDKAENQFSYKGPSAISVCSYIYI